jgi:formylmethanofuran dehydrogenase subunit E
MTEKERKAKAAELAARAKDLQRRMSEQAVRVQFKKQIQESDPKAASAMAQFNVRKRAGESAADIAASYSPQQKAAMRRSIEAADAFSRKLIDKNK